MLLVLAFEVRYGRSSVGWSLTGSGVPYVIQVAGVPPAGGAADGGVRAGDRLDLRAQTPADRVAVVRSPVRDRELHVVLARDGRSFSALIVPRHRGLRYTVWLAYVVLVWTAVFGGVIAWRRPGLAEARLLSLMLSTHILAVVVGYFRFPAPQADLAMQALADLCDGVSLAALVAFTALFGRPLSRWRALLNAVAYASVVVSVSVAMLGPVAIATLWFDPVPLAYGGWSVLFKDASVLLVLGCGAAAIAAARGSDRQRAVWAIVSMGPLIAISPVNDLLAWLAPNVAGDVRVFTIYNVAGIMAPVGLTYSVLSRRLLDIGFALNRAVVFSAVSIVVVGLFMAVETLLGGWLVTVSRAESLAVSVAVALAIGFSIRWIHGRIDRFVDLLFFHKRHRGEQALLRFAHEAAFVTDRDVLLSRAVDEVAQHTEAQTVAILLRDGAGTYVCASSTGQPIPDAGENDAAVLSMRASGNPVDLHGRDGALRGEYAFPMMARGTLIGTLVCGAKPGAEPYAPDERDALRGVAHGVGMALDTLTSKAESLDAAIRALPEQFAALRAEIRELREALQQQST